MRALWCSLILLFGSFLTAPPALAGGFEVPAAGARSLGRGGAWAARADDPLALMYNPANLAELNGLQLHLDAHLLLFDGCVSRPGLAEVCNEGPPGFVPELVLSWRATNELGFGFGLIAPTAVGATRYGDPETGLAGAERSPVRYSLIEQNIILAYPTIGVAYRPHPRIRMGATFGAGFGIFDFFSMTRPLPGGDSVPDSLDIGTQLTATDWFVPRVGVSLHMVPHDSLDIMVGFTWQDDIEATGELDLVTGYYEDEFVGARTGSCPPGLSAEQMMRCQSAITDVTLSAAQPWQVSFGIRYADRLTPRPENAADVEARTGRTEDPMTNERWDIELDVVYEINSRLDFYRISFPGDYEVQIDPFLTSVIPNQTWIPHHWSDQFSIRLGGDYNIMPGLATIRAGFSFETRGVNEDFPTIDFWPYQRYGGHVGLTLRAGSLDINIGYALIIQETLTVEGGELRQTIATCTTCPRGMQLDPLLRTQQGGDLIADGTYTSSYHHVALGVNYRFN